MALLSLLAIGWLPGAVLFRLPVAGRERRASLDAEERGFWMIILSATCSLAIAFGLAWAHRYSVQRLVVADLLLAAGAAAVFRVRLSYAGTAKRPTLTLLIPIALIALGLWRFFPSSEYVMGGKDPGVYINEGVQIAQRGAIIVRDRTVATVPAFARDLFFPSYQQPTYYSVRFMGFFIKSPETGTVIGQFPHLFPVSIAIGYGLWGLTGAREVVGFWALAGLLGVYFVGARFVGRPAAAAAGGLLALNVIEVWFSRYPNTEVMMQALLFATLLAVARAMAERDGFFAPVAGCLLALLLFLRIDAVLAAGAVVATLALGFVAGQRLRWTFWPPFAAGTILWIAYLMGPMRSYAELPLVFASNLPTWEYVAASVTAIAAVLLLAGASRSSRVRDLTARWFPMLLTAGVILLAIYALFLRSPGGKLTDYDAYALRTYASFYVTVPAVIAALIGYALVARSLFWRDPAFMLTLTVFACFFFYKIRIVPDHFWMARRFLPVILPGTLLLASAAALAGVRGRWAGTRAVRALIGIAFLVVLAESYVRASAPVIPHVEYQGIIAKVEQLAATIHDDDLLVVESRNASDVHVLALPLAYIYAKSVLVLASPTPDKTVWAAFLDRAHAQYRRVLFLGGGGTDLISSRWSVDPVRSDRFQVPEYDAPLNAYPRFVRRKEFDYSVYVFSPPRRDDAPFDLDVGVDDDLNVVRFDAKEETEGRSFRWTQRRSYVIVNRLRPGDRAVTFWMSSGGRPPAAPPAVVTVSIGGRALGSLTVANGFAPYTLPFPDDVVSAAARSGEPIRLMLETPTWNPQRVLGTADERDLGVMVDRITVR